MSALHQLAHRHGFFSRADVAPLALDLAAAVAAATAPFREPGMLPEGLLFSLECELIYAVARHRVWVDAPLFAAVLVDHLATSFQLPRPVALSLASAPLAVARQQPRHGTLLLGVSDREFLRYICVATATAQDEPALLLDLGLGRRLLGRIKEALRLLVSIAPGQTTGGGLDGGGGTRFLPEFDSNITDVVCALGHELKLLPWLLQRERLRYTLAAMTEPWAQVVKDHGVQWLFDLLLTIASRKAMSTRQIATSLRTLYPAEPCFVLDSSVSALCQELARHNLLSLERGVSTWRALPLAEELTADAFAVQALELGEAGAAALPQLCGFYQTSMIRFMELTSAELEAVITTVRPLAPSALKAALTRLAAVVTPARLEATVLTLLAGESSSWLRKGTLEFAAGLGIASEAGSLAKSPPWLSLSTHSKPASTALD